MIQTISFNGFNNNNPYVRYFIQLKENTYIFILRWSPYCDCGFLSITDYNNNPIVTGKALVNNLKIRNYNLPYVMEFLQINGETYEPTIDNIENEFVLVYDDEEMLS